MHHINTPPEHPEEKPLAVPTVSEVVKEIKESDDEEDTIPPPSTFATKGNPPFAGNMK